MPETKLNFEARVEDTLTIDGMMSRDNGEPFTEGEAYDLLLEFLSWCEEREIGFGGEFGLSDPAPAPLTGGNE